MIFDVFHSISDPIIYDSSLGSKKVFENFIQQCQLAESLGADTIWCAESHFSSEIQKQTSVATIQNFNGEVGINCDSFQLFHLLVQVTHRINLGTAIHNIVGGSGGPISSSDRVNTLQFINQNFGKPQRTLRIGISSGRFPYQNTPFGINPRNNMEELFWDQVKRYTFLEALEIFLRLLRGQTLRSSDVGPYSIDVMDLPEEKRLEFSPQFRFPIQLTPRWEFEPLKLVPSFHPDSTLHIVLGSSDPSALRVAYPLWDIDLFNLSFTPPDQIDKLHAKMERLAFEFGREWTRDRLPRTVLVFIDSNRKKAIERASVVLDAYIEAMKGTAAVPSKHILLERALVGDATEIREQLHPDNPHAFHPDDRLMLWFEFNQHDGQAVCDQMKYFFEDVASRL